MINQNEKKMRTKNAVHTSTLSQTILLVIEHDHIMSYIFRIEMSTFGQKLPQQREASLEGGQ